MLHDMITIPEIDALVDELTEEVDEEEFREHRRHVRYNVDNLVLYITQLYEPGKPPSTTNLFPVRCKDFSCGGFAFWFPTRPSFRRLVVRLGNQENPIFMEVEVVHASLIKERPAEKVIRDYDGVEHRISLGAKLFQVGCRFISRIPAPSH